MLQFKIFTKSYLRYSLPAMIVRKPLLYDISVFQPSCEFSHIPFRLLTIYVIMSICLYSSPLSARLYVSLYISICLLIIHLSVFIYHSSNKFVYLSINVTYLSRASKIFPDQTSTLRRLSINIYHVTTSWTLRRFLNVNHRW